MTASKPEVFMHHGYLVTATKRMRELYPGATLYVRLTEHEATIAERDAAIEDFSGTAVQNGMECDRLRDQCAGYEARITRLEDALRDIAGKHHHSASAGEYFSSVAQEALAQQGKDGET